MRFCVTRFMYAPDVTEFCSCPPNSRRNGPIMLSMLVVAWMNFCFAWTCFTYVSESSTRPKTYRPLGRPNVVNGMPVPICTSDLSYEPVVAWNMPDGCGRYLPVRARLDFGSML